MSTSIPQKRQITVMEDRANTPVKRLRISDVINPTDLDLTTPPSSSTRPVYAQQCGLEIENMQPFDLASVGPPQMGCPISGSRLWYAHPTETVTSTAIPQGPSMAASGGVAGVDFVATPYPVLSIVDNGQMGMYSNSYEGPIIRQSVPYPDLTSHGDDIMPSANLYEMEPRYPVAIPQSTPAVPELDGEILSMETPVQTPAESRKTSPTPTSTASSTPRRGSSRQSNPRPKIYPCPYPDCNKRFNRPCRLSDHVRTHTGDRAWLCPHEGCPKTFFRDTHLNRHIKESHEKNLQFFCEVKECGKGFTTKARLVRHGQSHEKDGLKCSGYPPCSEVFRKKVSLEAHIRSVHLGEKAYPCQYVDPVTGEKCEKGYDSAWSLKTHIKREHENQYRCEECVQQEVKSRKSGIQSVVNSTFATYTELQDHMRDVHPRRCPHCSEPVHRSAALRVHLELYHPDAPEVAGLLATSTASMGDGVNSDRTWTCERDNCGRIFSRRGILIEHHRIHHPKKQGRQRWSSATGRRKDTSSATGSARTGSQAGGNSDGEDNGAGDAQARLERAHRRIAGHQQRHKNNLLMKLTGHGYEESERKIRCPLARIPGCSSNGAATTSVGVEKCDWRFFSVAALEAHVRDPKMHALDGAAVAEVLLEARALSSGTDEPFWVGGIRSGGASVDVSDEEEEDDDDEYDDDDE